MLTENILNELNKQMNHEFTVSNWYLQASAILKNKGFLGFSKFFFKQYQEEIEHGLMFYDFILLNNQVPLIERTEKILFGDSGPLDLFQQAFSLEKLNTDNINSILYNTKTNDHAIINFLNKLVDEQLEEEAWAIEALDRIGLAGSDNAALLIIDSEYGQKS